MANVAITSASANVVSTEYKADINSSVERTVIGASDSDSISVAPIASQIAFRDASSFSSGQLRYPKWNLPAGVQTGDTIVMSGRSVVPAVATGISWAMLGEVPELSEYAAALGSALQDAFGTLELADRQMVSGATRLAYTLVQIVLLVFGLLAAFGFTLVLVRRAGDARLRQALAVELEPLGADRGGSAGGGRRPAGGS